MGTTSCRLGKACRAATGNRSFPGRKQSPLRVLTGMLCEAVFGLRSRWSEFRRPRRTPCLNGKMWYPFEFRERTRCHFRCWRAMLSSIERKSNNVHDSSQIKDVIMGDTQKYAVTWDLDSLFPHPESDGFQSVFKQFRADLQKLAEQSDALPAISGDADNVSQWKSFLTDYEKLHGNAIDLEAFIGCHAAADANNKLFLKLEADIAALEPLQARIATNIEFALQEADDEAMAAFIGGDDWLQQIQFYLDDSRKNSQMRLPKEQELRSADLAVDGIHAWGRLYDRISGEMRISVMEKGEVVEKSPGQVHFDSAHRADRENNFYAADKAWSTIADTCADSLNHISGVRLTKYQRLGLQDHLDAPLRFNRLQRETLTAMWLAINDAKPTLKRYLEKKAEMLGVDRMAWYDQQAPLPAAAGANSDELTYDEACDLVIETFTGFSPEFGEFARRGIEDRWIEVENREGKRQGGFCTGFPTKQQSRIFMTFTNSLDSMSTLAHELGHAYHSHVLRDQPLFLQDYPMNLAETASTFAEAVLGEQRLQASDSVPAQLEILDKMLSDAVAFLMNIHARFIFEDNFHKERTNGEVSSTRLSELMLAAQKEAYLDALADDGWNPNFWISKLHFYISGLPFYNFPYTFGYLLSLGAYAVAKESGDAFPEQYRQLLIATGCMETEDAVQSTLGFDLTTDSFWKKSLEVVTSRVESFMQLAESN